MNTSIQRIAPLFSAIILASCGAFQAPGEPTAEDPQPLVPETQRSPTYPYKIPPDEPEPQPDPTDYVTDMMAYASCFELPHDIAVPKGHAQHGECEWLQITPAMDDGKDFFEVGGEVEWMVEDGSIAAIECQDDWTHDTCWPVGQKDIFDRMQTSEPATDFLACHQNICPAKVPTGFPVCEPIVCAWFKAVVVVNLEGTWILNSTIGYHSNNFSPQQNGRSFTDPSNAVKKGLVMGLKVTFDIDDTEFRGTLTNENRIEGTAWDLLNDQPLGDWAAQRLTP